MDIYKCLLFFCNEIQFFNDCKMKKQDEIFSNLKIKKNFKEKQRNKILNINGKRKNNHT